MLRSSGTCDGRNQNYVQGRAKDTFSLWNAWSWFSIVKIFTIHLMYCHIAYKFWTGMWKIITEFLFTKMVHGMTITNKQIVPDSWCRLNCTAKVHPQLWLKKGGNQFVLYPILVREAGLRVLNMGKLHIFRARSRCFCAPPPPHQHPGSRWPHDDPRKWSDSLRTRSTGTDFRSSLLATAPRPLNGNL